MKKFLLFFALLVLLIPQKTFSQTSEPSLAVVVEYELPYPGLLPGSPLYPLKALRDRILELVLADPVKKSEFYLLQADKRLSASLKLFEMGEKEKGEETISKGLNYLEKSISMVYQAKDQRESSVDISSRIKVSTAKQKQEIKNLINSSNGELREKLEESYRRAVEIEKSANEISPN